jgi:hypothetical protein
MRLLCVVPVSCRIVWFLLLLFACKSRCHCVGLKLFRRTTCSSQCEVRSAHCLSNTPALTVDYREANWDGAKLFSQLAASDGLDNTTPTTSKVERLNMIAARADRGALCFSLMAGAPLPCVMSSRDHRQLRSGPVAIRGTYSRWKLLHRLTSTCRRAILLLANCSRKVTSASNMWKREIVVHNNNLSALKTARSLDSKGIVGCNSVWT